MATILVIDDEPLVCDMLEVLLTRAGYDVLIANDGQQALDVIASKARIDMVIADIVMPEMDGLEAIQSMIKNDKTIKIIAISGGSRIGNIDFLEIAKKFGACRTFYKPIDNKKLLAAVKEILQENK